jgi:hypothetical protein
VESREERGRKERGNETIDVTRGSGKSGCCLRSRGKERNGIAGPGDKCDGTRGSVCHRAAESFAHKREGITGAVLHCPSRI